MWEWLGGLNQVSVQKMCRSGVVPNVIYTGADVDMKYYVQGPALLWSGNGIHDCDVNVSGGHGSSL